MQIFLGVTAFGGIFVVGALLVEPSQSGGFLGYSTGRWAILILNSLILTGIIFTFYKISVNQASSLERWLSRENNLFFLFFASFLIFLISIPISLGKIEIIRYFTYFGRIQPSLIWLSFSSGVFFFSLLILQPLPLQKFFPDKADASSQPSLKKKQIILMLGAGILYFALQMQSFLIVREAKKLVDSSDYTLPASTFAWNDLRLWTFTKPWGAAVFYKLVGVSPSGIDLAQTLFSIFAWLMLAWAFSQIIRNYWLRVIVFFFILGFSLASSVQLWNHVIQSESLSISLMVLILATWLLLAKKWHWAIFTLLIFLFAWWIGTRETNIYLSLLVAGSLALIGLFYKKQRFYWILSILIVIFSYQNVQISKMLTMKRWLYPLTNIVLYRILPNEEFLAYFAEENMPISPELLALSGNFAHDDDFALFNSRALNDAETWMLKSGKKVYIQFLLTHPIYTLKSPWENLERMLSPKGVENYAPQKYAPFMAGLFGGIFYPNSLWLLLFLTLLSLISIKFSLKKSSVFGLLFGFLLLFFPHFYIAWHGDALEVARHAIQASIALRLALWLLLFFSADAFLLPVDRNELAH